MKYVAVMFATAIIMIVGMVFGAMQSQVQLYNLEHPNEEQVNIVDAVWLATHPDKDVNDVLASK